MECERGNIASGIEPGGIDGRDLGYADAAGTVSFTVQVTDAANNTGTKALSIAVAAGATATRRSPPRRCQRHGRHGVLNHAAGEWWNYAVQLECECGNIASGIEPGGIDGRDFGYADDDGHSFVYSSSERHSK